MNWLRVKLHCIGNPGHTVTSSGTALGFVRNYYCAKCGFPLYNFVQPVKTEGEEK